jgi:hypothetical protein
MKLCEKDTTFTLKYYVPYKPNKTVAILIYYFSCFR